MNIEISEEDWEAIKIATVERAKNGNAQAIAQLEKWSGAVGSSATDDYQLTITYEVIDDYGKEHEGLSVGAVETAEIEPDR